jgi:Flp pilus assembly protein TadB
MDRQFLFPFNRTILCLVEISSAAMLLGMFMFSRLNAQGNEFRRVEEAQIRERLAKTETVANSNSGTLLSYGTRIEKLEQTTANMSGMGAALAAVLGAVGSVNLVISLKK